MVYLIKLEIYWKQKTIIFTVVSSLMYKNWTASFAIKYAYPIYCGSINSRFNSIEANVYAVSALEIEMIPTKIIIRLGGEISTSTLLILWAKILTVLTGRKPEIEEHRKVRFLRCPGSHPWAISFLLTFFHSVYRMVHGFQKQ